MSAPGLDPTFSELPHRRLGDVALARAQELGATHADFRFERNRYQYLGARDGNLQTASDAEDLGFAVRVVHGGAWGFASGVVLTDDEARRLADTAVAVARVAAAMTTTPVELAPEPVHDDVTWISGYDVNPLDVPTREKADLLVDWTERLRASSGGRPRDRLPAAGAGEQVLRRPVRHPHHAAARTPPARVRGHRRGRGDRHLRLDGLHRAAGRPRLGVPLRTPTGTGTPSWPRSPTCSPRSSGRPASRPAPTTWWSTPPTCGSRSTSPSGTRPSSTAHWATRPTTPARRSPPTTSSARSSTAPR